jgi:hypothetical protein
MKKIVFAYIILLTLAACSSSNTQQEKVFTTIVNQDIYFEQGIAGEHLEFSLPWTKEVPLLYMEGLNFLVQLEPILEKDSLKINLPSKSSEKAGIYIVNAVYHDTLKTLAEIEIASRTSEGKITSFIGPKSILNNGLQESELTYFPTDKFGNPSGDQTRLFFSKSDDGYIQGEDFVLSGNYGIQKLTSTAGNRINAGIANENGNSEERQIRTLSLCPTKIELFTENLLSIANGKQFFKVWTNFLIDENGQQVSDGTSCTFNVYDSNDKIVASYKAYTVNGIASCWVRNPTKAGSYKLEVFICNIEQVMKIGPFRSLVTDFNFEWNEDYVKVGPIINDLGQFIPDGTPISLAVEIDEEEQKLTKDVFDGFVFFNWDEFWSTTAPHEALLEINHIIYPINSQSL